MPFVAFNCPKCLHCMPLIYHKQLPGQTQMGVWKVEETIQDLKSRLILDQEELAFYETLNKGKRNLHWLSGRVLIRNLLNTNHFIEVQSDEYGKPHLVNFDYELSISHSQDYAAVIISQNRVGIDIEQMRPKIRRIAHKFMREEELAFLAKDEDEAMRQMFVVWTGKEALYKLYGKRNLNFCDHMQFEPFLLGSPSHATAHLTKPGLEQTFTITFEEIDGYMMAYTIEDG